MITWFETYHCYASLCNYIWVPVMLLLLLERRLAEAERQIEKAKIARETFLYLKRDEYYLIHCPAATKAAIASYSVTCYTWTHCKIYKDSREGELGRAVSVNISQLFVLPTKQLRINTLGKHCQMLCLWNTHIFWFKTSISHTLKKHTRTDKVCTGKSFVPGVKMFTGVKILNVIILWACKRKYV